MIFRRKGDAREITACSKTQDPPHLGQPTLIHKMVLVKMAEKKIQKFFLGGGQLAKSLIFHGLLVCFAASQFVEVRMKSAFWHVKTHLHTKLSTEFVDSEKMPFAPEI
jgi:hypothetical protein